jgi:EAL domain-containing protein (putative c-di-GMP-specific phosphodiesterase class I)
VADTAAFIDKFRAMGVKIALVDFGSDRPLCNEHPRLPP